MGTAVCVYTSEDPMDIWIGLYAYTSEDPPDIWVGLYVYNSEDPYWNY